MEMVLHKLSRCMNGDRYYLDNIDDMINYLRLYKEEIVKRDSEIDKEVEKLDEKQIKELWEHYNFK